MLISLRSRMTAGAVAMAGAGTLVLAPAIQTSTELPVLQSHSVELAALASPITEFMASMDLIVNDLFNGYDTYAPYEMWQGIVPEFIYNALPTISTLGYNGSYYLDTLLHDLVTGPTSTLVSLGNGVLYLPGALIDATVQAVTGDFSGALTTLANAIVDPIVQAATSAYDGVSTVVGGMLTNLVNIVVTVPSLVKSLIDTTVEVTKVLFGVATEIGSNLVSAITSLDFEDVWNTAVEGLLGPTGFPGALESLTLGPGLGDWGTADYVPSFRVWAQTTIYTIADALGGAYPVAAAAAAAPIDVVPQSAAASLVPAPSQELSESRVETITDTAVDGVDIDTAVDTTADIEPSVGSARQTAAKSSNKAKSVADGGDSTSSAGPRSAGTGHAKARGGLRAAG